MPQVSGVLGIRHRDSRCCAASTVVAEGEATRSSTAEVVPLQHESCSAYSVIVVSTHSEHQRAQFHGHGSSSCVDDGPACGLLAPYAWPIREGSVPGASGRANEKSGLDA